MMSNKTPRPDQTNKGTLTPLTPLPFADALPNSPVAAQAFANSITTAPTVVLPGVGSNLGKNF